MFVPPPILPPPRIHSHSESASGTDLHLHPSSIIEKLNGSTTSPGTEEATATNVKKANMRTLIERYFYQLLEGCPDQQCQNINCKSSGQVPTLTPNQAAAKALELFFQGASLCQTLANSDRRPGVQPRSAPHNVISAGGGDESPSSSSLLSIKPNCDKNGRTGLSTEAHSKDDDHDQEDER